MCFVALLTFIKAFDFVDYWLLFCMLFDTYNDIKTRSSATAKSTARPLCLIGVLYEIFRE